MNSLIYLSLTTVFIALVIFYFLGRILLDFFITSRLAQSITLIIGLILSCLVLQLFSLFSIPWEGIYFFLAIMVIFILFRKRFSRIIRNDLHTLLNLKIQEIFLLSTFLPVLSAYLLRLIYQPITSWDAIAMWQYKSKIILFNNGLTFFPSSDALLRHADYPPLIPYSTALLNMLMSSLEPLKESAIISSKSIDIIFLITAISSAYIFIRRYWGYKWAYLISLALLAFPYYSPYLIQQDYMGTADFSFAMIFLITTIFISKYIFTGSNLYLYISLFLSVVSSYIKNEGTVLFFTIFVITIFALAKNYGLRSKRTIVVSLFAIMPVILWKLYSALQGYKSEYIGALTSLDLPSVPGKVGYTINAIASYFANDIFLIMNILLFVGCFFYSLLVKKSFTPIFLIVFAQLLFYVLVYAITPYSLSAHLETSLDRVMFHLLPSVLFITSIFVLNMLKSSRK